MGLKKGNIYSRIDSVGWNKENNLYLFVNLYKNNNRNKIDMALQPIMIERKRLQDGSIDPKDKYTSENISKPDFKLITELYKDLKANTDFFKDFEDDI